MSTDAVHFLKIAGNLAAEVEVACEAIRLRKPGGGAMSGSHDWHRRDRVRIDHLGAALRAAARSLPVITYSQFLTYAVGSPADGHLNWPADLQRHICSANTGIAWFASPDFPQVLEVIKGELRRKRPRSVDYIRHLQLAIANTGWIHAPTLIVVIAECLGPSREDDEVHAAAQATLSPLLKATQPPDIENIDGRSAAGLRRRLRRIAQRVNS